LRSLELLGPERDPHTTVCPLCASPLEDPDPSAADITRLTEDLAGELEQAQALQPVRQEHRQALLSEREAALERLRVNGTQLRELAAADERMRDLQDQQVRIARIQGRIDQALTTGTTASSQNISSLRNDLASAQDNAETLQALTDEDDVAGETQRRLTDIATNLSEWAKRLNLGQAASAEEVTISLSQLNVVVRLPDRRLPLNRIGSAKNWIGYHMVAHLALHTYLRFHNRPVPGFLMIDQPTQAFFPEKIRDATTVEDADWATVTAYFELLKDVVDLNEGALQIIVCDHANLTDEKWFQDALVDNWRPDANGRRALIPPDWLPDPDLA
jgi:hypothetical protein